MKRVGREVNSFLFHSRVNLVEGCFRGGRETSEGWGGVVSGRVGPWEHWGRKRKERRTEVFTFKQGKACLGHAGKTANRGEQ